MGGDRPAGDAFDVGALRDAFVRLEPLELGVEGKAALPPLVEVNVASPDGAQPIGRFTLNGKLKLVGGEQLDTLIPEASGVHRVFGVVAVLGDELLPVAAPSSAMHATAQPK